MWIDYMAYSDRAIIDSVRAFQNRDDVTITEIATHANMPLRTAQRAIDRLKRAGKITQSGCGRRWGHRFEVVEHVTCEA